MSLNNITSRNYVIKYEIMTQKLQQEFIIMTYKVLLSFSMK